MSNANTPETLAHSMAQSLLRENESLRAEVASLKEDIDNLKAYAKHERSLGAEPWMLRCNDLTQQLAAANAALKWWNDGKRVELEAELAAANGRVEMMRDYASTIAAFKNWYDAQWLGDLDHGQFIPLPSDKQYQEYIDGYTLALGAWVAALSINELDRESKMVILRTDETGKPTVWCDPEICDLVNALNTGSLETVASCSGHGHRPGRISLKDGREMMVLDKEQVREVEAHFNTDINGVSLVDEDG